MFLLATLLLAGAASAISPASMLQAMGLGVNLGNTLEAPHEGDWAPPAQESYIKEYVRVGFKHIRVPVQWHQHTSLSAPYKIDPNFLQRVRQVILWVVQHGAIAIVNTHGEHWMYNEQTFESNLPRWVAMWQQIAPAFADIPNEKLVFELFNEPRNLTDAQLNKFISSGLAAIRRSNPSRIVMIEPVYGSILWLPDNPNSLNLPQDPNILISVHNYDPGSFTFPYPSQKSWGSSDDVQKVTDHFTRLRNWSKTHAPNVPIHVGEFGCSNSQPAQARDTWYHSVLNIMKTQGFNSVCVWDDDGDFTLYHRRQNTWDYDVLYALGL